LSGSCLVKQSFCQAVVLSSSRLVKQSSFQAVVLSGSCPVEQSKFEQLTTCMSPILRNENFANRTNPRVFVNSIFEIKENVELPLTKKDLIPLLKANVVVPFHKHVCPLCHTIPKSKEWATAPDTGKFYSLFVFLSFCLSLFLYF
jgi:hypothetical protein